MFKGDSGKINLEVHYKIPCRQLSFSKEGEKYRTGYESAITMYNRELKKETAGEFWYRAHEVDTYDEAHSVNRYLSDSIFLQVDPGVYNIRFQIRDLKSRRSGIVESKNVRVSFDGTVPVAVSTLVMAHQPRSTVTFVGKGVSDVIPNPDMIFFDRDGQLYVYYELYPTVSTDTTTLRETVELIDYDGNVVHSISQTVHPPVELKPRFFHFPVDTVAFGFYQVVATGYIDDRTVYSREKEIQVRSHLFPYPFNIDTALLYLKYYAWGDKAAEIDDLEKEKEKIIFWHDFWNPQESESLKPTVESFERFLDRMFVVDEQYPPSQLSSISDRGIAYMRFGPPDDIERHPFELDSKAYEIWYYYSLGVQFNFVDEMGIGDYHLIDRNMKRLLHSH
jgi:GWxTD domain-containing protein